MAKRFEAHFDAQNIHEQMQSAYRKYHSIETALLRVHNDVLEAIDQRECVFLLLLNLSAASDTVDHAILLQRLQQTYGISGKVHEWFQSYLQAGIT